MGNKIKKKQYSSTFLIFVLIQLVLFSNCFASKEDHRYFDEADEALLSGDYDKAVSNYLKGINYADKTYISKVWDDLGYAYLQKEKFTDAINYLKNSISAHPENYNARLYLAAAYLSTDELTLGSREIEQIEKDIYFDQSWLSDAKNLLLLNECADQISIYELERLWREKGVFLQKNLKDSESRNLAVVYIDAFNETNEVVLRFMKECIHTNLDDYQSSEVSREIIPRIQHRLEDHENSLLGHKFQRSLEELKKGEISASIQALEESMIINEKSFTINHNLALLYFDMFQLDPEKTDKLEKAEYYCARALWFRKHQIVDTEEIIGCYDLMANIYSLLMAYEKSLREYKKILEFDPKNAHAHYNLGVVYFNIKDYKSAENEWLNVIELEKESRHQEEDKGVTGKETEHTVTVKKRSISHLSHLALGNLYLKQHQTERAISELEKAVAIRTNAADPHLSLAKAYQELGNKGKAVFHLERYLFLGGKDEKEAKELIKQLKN